VRPRHRAGSYNAIASGKNNIVDASSYEEGSSMRHYHLAGIAALAALTALGGCAHGPRGPVASQTPGTITFVITGAPDVVAAFAADSRIPTNCTRRASGQEKSDAKQPARAQVAFRCENISAATFTAFGGIFSDLVNRRNRQKQASLEPVRIAQDPGDALSLLATTTGCVPDTCFTGTPYWWMPQGACTDPCY